MSDRTAGCSPGDDPITVGARTTEIGEAQLLANETRMWLVIGTALSVSLFD